MTLFASLAAATLLLSGCAVAGPAAGVAETGGEVWEYRALTTMELLETTTAEAPRGSRIVAALNELGQDGWRLGGVSDHGTEDMFFLQRRLR